MFRDDFRDSPPTATATGTHAAPLLPPAAAALPPAPVCEEDVAGLEPAGGSEATGFAGGERRIRPMGGATRGGALPPRHPPDPLFGIPVPPLPLTPPLLALAGDRRVERPITVVAADGGAGTDDGVASTVEPDAKWWPPLVAEPREMREPGVEARVELVSERERWRSSNPRELARPPPPAPPAMPMPRLLFGEMERLAQESLLSRSESWSCLPC